MAFSFQNSCCYIKFYWSYSSEYAEKLPFVKPAPIDQEQSAKQKKQKGGKKAKNTDSAAAASADAAAAQLEKVKLDK